jgi:hypothetical protein
VATLGYSQVTSKWESATTNSEWRCDGNSICAKSTCVGSYIPCLMTRSAFYWNDFTFSPSSRGRSI